MNSPEVRTHEVSDDFSDLQNHPEECARLFKGEEAIKNNAPMPLIYAADIKAAADQAERAEKLSCSGQVDEAWKVARGNNHMRDFARKVEARFPELKSDSHFQRWD
jgi:hypothetical protein